MLPGQPKAFATDGTFVQAGSFHSEPGGVTSLPNLVRDTGRTDRVLLGREYAYWGGSGPLVPQELRDLVRRADLDAGAAEVQVEQGWEVGAVVTRVQALMADADKLAQMADASLAQARLDAADRAADVIEGLL